MAFPVLPSPDRGASSPAPRRHPFDLREPTPDAPRPRSSTKPRLLDQVRNAIRVRHYSPRTERSYVAWIRRFILFNDRRHPETMGVTEVERFLSSLAASRPVSASTQNQALAAILFL